jgi:hypothetical protein
MFEGGSIVFESIENVDVIQLRFNSSSIMEDVEVLARVPIDELKKDEAIVYHKCRPEPFHKLASVSDVHSCETSPSIE